MAITKYYSMNDALLQYGQKDGVVNPNATTMEQMQNYMKQNGDILDYVVKSHLWQPKTAYAVDAEVHSPNMPAGYHAQCTQAGTSDDNEPVWTLDYETFNDGGVVWKLVSQKEQILQKVDYDDILTLEEIEASTELADTDVASASALKDAVKIETGEGTKGDKASQISNVRWFKFGRVVIVCVDDMIVPDTVTDRGNAYVFIRNLPKAIPYSNYFNIGYGKRLGIGVDGTVFSWWTTITSGQYTFQFSYICAEGE